MHQLSAPCEGAMDATAGKVWMLCVERFQQGCFSAKKFGVIFCGHNYYSVAGPFFLYAYGTGSMPPGLKGLHRKIRLTAKYPPFSVPCRNIASYAY